MFFLRPTAFLALLLTFPGFVISPATQTRGRRYRLEIHNHSTVIIDRIYMSRSNDGKWGQDRLGSEVLEPQHYFPIDDILGGEYDFLFVDEDERNCEWRDFRVFGNRELEIDDKWLQTHCTRD